MWARPGTITLDFPTTSFPDDGLTMLYDGTAWFNGPYYVNYLSFGGDDFDAFVGTATLLSGTTSTAVTGVGFQPDCIFFHHLNKSGSVNNNESSAPGFGYTMGAGSSNNVSVAHSACYLCSISAVLNHRYFNTDKCITGLEPGIPATLSWEAELSSFDADGFTLTHTSMPGNRLVYYLAIRDGFDSFVIGTDTQRTTNGSKTTSGLGITPGLAVFCSTHDTSVDAVNTVRAQMIGAAADNGDGIQQCVSTHLRRESTNRSATRIQSDRALSLITTGAAVAGVGQVTDFAPGEFTIDWTSVDGSARRFGYLAASCSESEEGMVPKATIFFSPNANTTEALTEAVLGWSVGFQAAAAGARNFLSHSQPDDNYNSAAWVQGSTADSVSLGSGQLRTLARIGTDTPFPGGVQQIFRYNIPRQPFTAY